MRMNEQQRLHQIEREARFGAVFLNACDRKYIFVRPMRIGYN